jgi:sensor domain CHASE-containing protein
MGLVPWWAWMGLAVVVALAVFAATVNTVATVTLINSQRRQREELAQQRADFCAAERDIRAKIAEIETEIGTHIYVYIPPSELCR